MRFYLYFFFRNFSLSPMNILVLDLLGNHLNKIKGWKGEC